MCECRRGRPQSEYFPPFARIIPQNGPCSNAQCILALLDSKKRVLRCFSGITLAESATRLWNRPSIPSGLPEPIKTSPTSVCIPLKIANQKMKLFFVARTPLTLTGNLHDVDFVPVRTVLGPAKKSCLKTYRRFFVLSGLCQNERMNMKNSSMRNGERAPRQAQGFPQSRPNPVKPGQGLTSLIKPKQG
jgi:hypothetical protein